MVLHHVYRLANSQYHTQGCHPIYVRSSKHCRSLQNGWKENGVRQYHLAWQRTERIRRKLWQDTTEVHKRLQANLKQIRSIGNRICTYV